MSKRLNTQPFTLPGLVFADLDGGYDLADPCADFELEGLLSAPAAGFELFDFTDGKVLTIISINSY